MQLFGQEITIGRAGMTLAVALFIQGFYRLYQARSKFWALQRDHGILTLPHSFLFGHLVLVGRALTSSAPDAHQQLSMWLLLENFHPELWAQGFFYLDLWPVQYPLLTCFDPDIIAQFTQVKSQPKSRLLTDQFRRLTGGNDLLSIDGAAWKMWRTVFNPGFSVRNLVGLVGSFVDEIEVYHKVLGEAADNGTVIKLADPASKLAFDVIGNVVLGARLHSHTSDRTFYTTFLQRLSWNFPDWSLRSLPNIVNPLRPVITRYLDHVINRELISHIDKELKSEEQQQGSKTILNLAIKAYLKQVPEDSSPPKSAADLDPTYLTDVLAHLRVFLIAGFDTTSYVLCAVMWQLHQHPECLAKVREEHDGIFGGDPAHAAQMIKDDASLLWRLQYTAAVIRETMRLQPVTGTVRTPEPGFVLTNPATNQPIPTEGFVLFSSAHALHQNPKLWPRRREFIPERWLVPEGHELHYSTEGFRPFELGPRSCVGQNMVMMELKSAMILILKDFDIVPQYDQHGPRLLGELAYQVPADVTTRPKDGMPVKIQRREA